MIVATLSTKGGVGKSSVTAGLASAAWAAETPVTVVDADANGNVSWALGVEFDGQGLADCLRGTSIEAQPSGWGDPVNVIPAGTDLGSISVGTKERQRLANLLKALGADGRLVLVDCPAGVGPIVQTVLEVADAAVVITEPSSFGVLAVTATDGTIAQAKKANSKLENLGVIVNRLPGRGREARTRLDELQEQAGRRLWRPAIPARVVMAEAVADGTPIHTWGVRGAEIAGIFDAYLSRLLRRR